MEVMFIKSPTGRPFLLAYSAGERATLPGELAEKLIEAGIAVAIEPIETAEDRKPEFAEKAVKRTKRK